MTAALATNDTYSPSADRLSTVGWGRTLTPRRLPAADAHTTACYMQSVTVSGASAAENDAITSEKPLSERVAKSLTAQRALLLDLRQDWDGYGAQPLDAGVVDTLIDDLRSALKGKDVKAPQIVPGGDGSVQAEWHQRVVAITYSYSPEGERYCWVQHRMGGGYEFEYHGEKAVGALTRWSHNLS